MLALQERRTPRLLLRRLVPADGALGAKRWYRLAGQCVEAPR